MHHILVVDDEPAMLRLLKLTIEAEGYRVSTARSRDEALKLVRKDAPAVIVLDLMMPGMPAREFMQRLREEGFRSAVLVLSANHAGLEIGALIGADEAMEKPFDVDELIATIRRLSSQVTNEAGDDG